MNCKKKCTYRLILLSPHRVWALWWQGGNRHLRTSRCPCRGRLGTLKTPSCPWHGCPAAGQNLETGQSVPSLYCWNIAECDVKPQSTINNQQHFIERGFCYMAWMFTYFMTGMFKWKSLCLLEINKCSSPLVMNIYWLNIFFFHFPHCNYIDYYAYELIIFNYMEIRGRRRR